MLLQPAGELRVAKDERGGVESEIPEELFLWAENHTAHGRMHAVSTDKQIHVHLGTVGQSDAHTARCILDACDARAEAEISSSIELLAQRRLEIGTGDAQQTSRSRRAGKGRSRCARVADRAFIDVRNLLDCKG
jgi:hypothetical protein